jgi:hypothetical protein
MVPDNHAVLSPGVVKHALEARCECSSRVLDLLDGKLVRHACRLLVDESRDEGPPLRLDKCNQFSFQGASHKSGDRRGARIEVTGITFG